MAEKPNVLIAVPDYGGSIKTACVKSIYGTMDQLARDGGSCGFTTLDLAGIGYVRNLLVARFLEQAAFTHLLFVDSDMDFPPAVVLKMLKANKPLIGAAYPKRSLPTSFTVTPLPTKPEPVNGLLRVASVGAGILLIQRSVFAGLIATGKVRTFKFKDVALFGVKDCLFGFFDTTYVGDFEHSEDTSFCTRWTQLCGGEVWAVTDHEIGHIGDFNYRGKYS